MHGDDRPGLLAGGPKRIPVVTEEGRQADQMCQIGEGDRVITAISVLADLVRGDVGVQQIRESGKE